MVNHNENGLIKFIILWNVINQKTTIVITATETSYRISHSYTITSLSKVSPLVWMLPLADGQEENVMNEAG